MRKLAAAARLVGFLLALAARAAFANDADPAGLSVTMPHCERQSRPPVRGEVHQRKLPSGSEAFEFDLEAGCSYGLYEKPNIARCLRGAWVVLIGASQTNIWTSVLANALVPNALLAKRDNFSIDGVFTQMIDIVIDLDAGKVVHRNVMVDERYGKDLRIEAHTRQRDAWALKMAFAKAADAPRYSSSLVRITNFFAEYWDNVDMAVEAVHAQHHWDDAKVTMAIAIGLWYINSLHCSATASWCATRPELGKLSLDGLVGQFQDDMEGSLTKLEKICAPGGRAGELGCSIASIDHCQFMTGDVWHRIFDAVKESMEQRATSLFRFVDLWTLTLTIPEDCIGGHQSPMSTTITWQVFFSGFCKSSDAAEGTLFSFQGSRCRSDQVKAECPNNGRTLGFHYAWECALAEPCTMTAVRPPKSLMPVQMAMGTVHLDLERASQVRSVKTWPKTYCAAAGEYHWCIALAACSIAAMVFAIARCREQPGGGKELRNLQYEQIDNSSGAKQGSLEVQASRVDAEQGAPKGQPNQQDAKPAVANQPADKFSFGLARCLASTHVVAGHLYAKQAIANLYLFSWGFTWVPWFFMLSGFILFSAEASNRREETWGTYVARRSVGIYPLYAVTLLLAFAIAKSQAAAPSTLVLLLQAWLGQAWVPSITERTLQMQCWFLSCLVVYWALFKPFFHLVSAMKSLQVVAALMAFCCALPWFVVLVPFILGDVQWYNEHSFGHSDTMLDLGVITLKFHPVCYLHVFFLGMLLGQFRKLLGAHSGNRLVQVAMEILAPMGYLILGLIFCWPALRPQAAKLSARLSVLLPLQSAILMGLAGLPGSSLPFVARVAGHFNFLESYSYAVYVSQFVCYHLWPVAEVGISFFLFLASVAVLMVHLVQKPSEWLWRHLLGNKGFGGAYACMAVPAVLSCALVGLNALPDPEMNADLPAMIRLDDRLVDVRLPIRADGPVLINPSLLFRGDEVVIVARQHRRESERLQGTYQGESVTVLQETWHSDIVVGRMSLNRDVWDKWLTSGRPPKLPKLSPWTGLRTPAGSRWVHLCTRETWLPENHTLVRLVVTGPEDAKVFQYPGEVGTEAIGLAFSSYPPLGRKGCDRKKTVPQMYLASAVNPSQPWSLSTGFHLQCGSDSRAEKNWIPFESNGKLHFVYSVLPHVVIEAQQDGRCGHRHYSNFAPLVRLQAKQPGLAFRGSAQALFIDDPQATPNLPKPHFLAFLHIVDPKTHRYAHFAYRFAADPPFDILQVSTQLPIRAATAEEVSGTGFAFVSGVAIRDRQVVISYASGDRDPRALILTLWRLDEMFHEESLAHAQKKVGSETDEAMRLAA